MGAEREKIRILFVDDDELLLEQAQIFLEDLHDRFEVDTVTSVEEGMKKLEEVTYDAIISDYKMPSTDGLEMLRDLRSRGDDIPFIVFTGRGDEEVAQKSLDLGADHYIRKLGDAKSQYDKLASRVVKTVESRGERGLDFKKEQMLEEEKEDIHSKLRHDIRNNIQLVKGYIHLLEDTELDEEQEEMLGKADASLEKMTSLVEKVEYLERLDSERIDEVPVDTVIREVVDEYGSLASEHGIEIELEEDLKEMVMAGDLLQAVFSNLIENSIIHSSGERITITGQADEDGLTVVIEDDGKGLPDTSKSKLCDKDFSEGENAGSGLGMYIVKRVLNRYRGELNIIDSEQGGARFEVRLNLP